MINSEVGMMTEIWKGSVGERLLQLRNQKGMTQEELAEYLNVSRQSVSKWELNKTLPDVDKLMQLSELYEVTLDYLVKGVETPSEEEGIEDDLASENEELRKGLTEEERMLEKSGEAGTEALTNQQPSSFELTVHRIVFLLAMIVCGVLCVGSLVFGIRLLGNHTFSVEDKQQEVSCVDQVYEQYTLAEVTVWDDELNYHKEKVWLDTTGVREGDYIGYYYEDGKSATPLFRYYSKTLILPLIVCILLLIFTIVFWMGFRHCGGGKE